MSLTFYGKKTCVTCQKAKAFLDQRGVAYREVPIETQPPSRELLEALIDEHNIKAALNTRSKAYKEKGLNARIPDKATVIDWMLEDPNLIKRPVLVKANGQAQLGFEEGLTGDFLS